MAVCAFIIVAGLALFEGDNMVPFAPMGVAGIARGSAVAFYGYLGFDEVLLMLMCMLCMLCMFLLFVAVVVILVAAIAAVFFTLTTRQ